MYLIWRDVLGGPEIYAVASKLFTAGPAGNNTAKTLLMTLDVSGALICFSRFNCCTIGHSYNIHPDQQSLETSSKKPHLQSLINLRNCQPFRLFRCCHNGASDGQERQQAHRRARADREGEFHIFCVVVDVCKVRNGRSLGRMDNLGGDIVRGQGQLARDKRCVTNPGRSYTKSVREDNPLHNNPKRPLLYMRSESNRRDISSPKYTPTRKTQPFHAPARNTFSSIPASGADVVLLSPAPAVLFSVIWIRFRRMRS